MSRIEEALKKAREATTAGTVAIPPAEVFQDPWAVDAAAPTDVARGFSPVPGDPVPGGSTTTDVAPGLSPVPEAAASAPAGPADPAVPGAEASATTAAVPADSASLALFQGFNPALSEKIVSTPDILPGVTEQYRRLAGALHHAQLEKNLKVLLITSAMAGEGKTLTSTNLALTFSESYRRTVLLIDADLRRPTLHETFQVPNLSGLGDGLRSKEEQKLSLVQVSPRLTVLTAGRPDPDPMSCLTSERMIRVIEEAKARFDWVIIDTPPIGLLPDAKLLAQLADTCLLVIQAGRTPHAMVQRSVDALGRQRIFGVVLNRAEETTGPIGYDYYNYYGGYGRDR